MSNSWASITTSMTWSKLSKLLKPVILSKLKFWFEKRPDTPWMFGEYCACPGDLKDSCYEVRKFWRCSASNIGLQGWEDVYNGTIESSRIRDIEIVRETSCVTESVTNGGWIGVTPSMLRDSQGGDFEIVTTEGCVFGLRRQHKWILGFVTLLASWKRKTMTLLIPVTRNFPLRDQQRVNWTFRCCPSKTSS